MNSISVITVNYNSENALRDCLVSLEEAYLDSKSKFAISEVCIVDNASSDASLTSAKAAVSSLPLKIQRNKINRGFGAACNQAAEEATGEYLLFLNPDTIVNTGAINESLRYICNRDNVGVVSVQLRSQEGAIQRTCARDITPLRMIAESVGFAGVVPSLGFRMRRWDHDDTRSVDHVMGAYYLINADLFDNVGGFDERFFVFYEDVDLSKAVRDEGYELHFIGSEYIIHGSEEREVSPVRVRLSSESRIEYCLKHFNRMDSSVMLFALLVVEPLLRVLRSGLNLDVTRMIGLSREYFDLYCRLATRYSRDVMNL